jgi:phenylalanyl-tRNA synthetase alpha chain
MTDEAVKAYEEGLNLLEKKLESILSAESLADIENLRRELLGKSGMFPGLLKGIKDLPAGMRKDLGGVVNNLKRQAEEALDNKSAELKGSAGEDVSDLDYTLPGKGPARGKLHLITQTLDEILGVFRDMGFHIVEGPDIEDEWHNFEALRLHADHPARDSQDSFYLGEDRLLKTHTSPIQIRYMEENKPPIQMVAPGVCFRRDPFTSRHSPVFIQIEALMVDEGITFGHLKGVLTGFTRGFFGRERKVRFRPDFFPFVEPGCEMAMDCPFCKGSGCRVCSQSGWIEILGAGMVHPGVLENCGIDSKKYTGFAFGTGIERPAMIRYGIDDIRYFYENDFRFLGQF